MARPWTTKEVAFLAEAAGVLEIGDIQQELRRSAESVRHKAKELGLSLAVEEWPLVWCDECATWRTAVDDRTGRCSVCSMTELAWRAEARYSDALMELGEEERDRWLEAGACKSGRTDAQPMPRAPRLYGICGAERMRLEAEHLRRVERWQFEAERRRWDAARARLSRLRRRSDNK